MRDPYDVLGVPRDASPEEVRAAFRRLAARHHPDKNPDDPGAQQRFKEINAAHQLLSDPQKRAVYDRFGSAAVDPGAGGGGPFAGVPFDVADLNFDAIFGDLLQVLGIKLGDRGDIQREIELGFEEAALGCRKEITYERVEPCAACSGSGGEPGSAVDVCGACAGRGRVRYQQPVLPIAVERLCTRCRGAGRVPRVECGACRGSGLVARSRTIEVTVPPGVEDGATRIVERGGNARRLDRAPGDLELLVRVRSHPFFRRIGDDVVCFVPISFAQAALGGEVEVQTLEGRGRLRIPAGTQPGHVLRIRGKGIPHRLRGGRGDQLVEVGVQVPTQLSGRQRELIEELARELGESSKPQEPTFLEKLKGLFE